LAKKINWPKLKFLEKGLKVPAGGFDRLGFGWELHYYDFLHRWNGGVPSPDCFKVKNWNGEPTIARVRHFHGIDPEHADRDLRHAVYHTWNDLPRGSLPIASIGIEEDDWDLCTLLTFTWTDRYNKIYLLANLHDCGPYDPDDLSRLQLISNSLPQFLKRLRPYDDLKYRAWFQLPTMASELESVAQSLRDGGFDDFGEFAKIETRHSVEFYSDDQRFTIWLTTPNASIRQIPAPKNASNESCLLAIDAFQWNHVDATKHVKSQLRPLRLDRKLKKLGETPVK
jgi:hypothetical protein